MAEDPIPGKPKRAIVLSGGGARGAYEAGALRFLLDDFYPTSGVAPSAAHPAFLIDHALKRSRFDGRLASVTVDVVQEATENLKLRD